MSGISKLPKIVQQLIEQPLHFLIGFAPVSIALSHPSWWGGAIAAFIFGAVREWDQRPVRRWWDTILDLAFVTLGGAIAGWWLS